jgi:hypothetical protein
MCPLGMFKCVWVAAFGPGGCALLETVVAHDMVVARPAEQLARASHATLAVPGKVAA